MGCNCGGTPVQSAPIAGATTATAAAAPAPRTEWVVTLNDGSPPLVYGSDVEAYAAAGAVGGTVEERTAGA